QVQNSPRELPNTTVAQNNGLALSSSLWVISLISGIVLSLRVLAKMTRGRSLWWDDGIMICSWTTLFTATCLMQRAVALGFGDGKDALTFDQKNEIAKLAVFYSAFTTVVVCTARISFGVALLRCTKGVGKTAAWVIIVGLVCISMVPLFVA
ncbi:hypothetical protein F5Y15DRAFT_346624, partial [Xylariaceae sp. FL0016]